jgi:hypothetical protein
MILAIQHFLFQKVLLNGEVVSTEIVDATANLLHKHIQNGTFPLEQFNIVPFKERVN